MGNISSKPSKPADFQAKAAVQYPYNSPPVMASLSKPRYYIAAERDMDVTVSDGQRIAVDVYRPDAAGRYPALLAMSSYTKELQASDSPSLCNEAGDTEFFVRRGYAHVIADSRGSGHTGGEFTLFGEREIQDGVELIEWIARQPWCNGKVGMIGMSYFAVVQLLIAKKNPPALKCIFAYDPIYDLYRDCCYHGGCMSLFNLLMAYFWTVDHLVFRRDGSGRKNLMNWRSFLSFATRFILQKYRFDGPFMRERSGYWREGDLRIPVYVGSGWEYAVGLHLRGVFDVFRDARGPKRMLVGPPWVPMRPYQSWRIESLRWYDRWLKGKNKGIDKEPPISIWIMGKNRWRSEREWPIARTRYIDLYLRPLHTKGKIGALSANKPETAVIRMCYRPLFSRAGFGSKSRLVYRSLPLCSELEITGHIVLSLHASCTSRDTNFFVRFCDESRDGSYQVISRGWLKASHHSIDPERTLPYRPFHAHTGREKLIRNTVYEFLIEIWPVSNLFAIGHRIRLEVAGAESMYHDFPYAHFPSLSTGKVAIHSSPEHLSRLTLPVLDSAVDFGSNDSNIRFERTMVSYFITSGRDRLSKPLKGK